MGAMLGAVVVIRDTCQRAIPLAMMTMKSQKHGSLIYAHGFLISIISIESGHWSSTYTLIHLATNDALLQVTRPSLVGGEVAEEHKEQGEVTKHSSVEVQLKDRLILLR